MRVDAGLADQRHGFAHRLQHRGGDEIAAELHEICRLRHLADSESFLSHCVEKRHANVDDLRLAGSDDEELALSGGVRPSKHGCSDETTTGGHV